MKRMLISVFLALIVSCAATQKQNSLININREIESLAKNKFVGFKATGDIVYSIGGGRHRGRITQSIDQHMNFKCYFYTPFAQMLASVESDEDSAIIVIGEQEHRISRYDKIYIIPYFTIFPFSFSEFVRIITGRTIRNKTFAKAPSFNEKERNQTVLTWQTDSMNISLTYSKRKKRINSIVYTSLTDNPWKLTLSIFKGGICREIFFKSHNGDYFSLAFNKVEF
jgi:hypothetical protein